MRRKGSTRPYTMLTGLTAWTAQRFGWSDPGVEDEFVPIYEKCREFTGTSWERMYALYKSVKYVIDSGVPGDLVECGVWRGGSVMMIVYTLLAADVKDRNVFLYDTFEGMSKPTTEDADSTSRTPAEIRWRAEARETGNAWASASLAEVKRNVSSTGYPQGRLTFVKGRVEETIPRYDSREDLPPSARHGLVCFHETRIGTFVPPVGAGGGPCPGRLRALAGCAEGRG